MFLTRKTCVIYGGGGALGGAIARAFGREGATVYLAGRTLARLEAVARDIVSAGGIAHVARVDATDEHEVARHADAIAAEAGGIDVAVNAVGITHVQGVAINALSLEAFERPIHLYMRTLFVTAKAVSAHMIARRAGVFLTISTPAARFAFAGLTGFGSTCAAIEGFSRHLAADLGPHGVRVVCLRPDAVPEALAMGSHSREVFGPVAERAGLTIEAMLAGAADAALLRRSPTLADVAHAAVFAASDAGRAMTASVLNLSCGSVVD
jgi:3-oxoacyl-[acyl-carrier protein] reductase